MLLVYFKRNESTILQIVDFELDSIEELGEAMDIASGEGGEGGDFAIYFVVNHPKKAVNMDNVDPL